MKHHYPTKTCTFYLALCHSNRSTIHHVLHQNYTSRSCPNSVFCILLLATIRHHVHTFLLLRVFQCKTITLVMTLLSAMITRHLCLANTTNTTRLAMLSTILLLRSTKYHGRRATVLAVTVLAHIARRIIATTTTLHLTTRSTTVVNRLISTFCQKHSIFKRGRPLQVYLLTCVRFQASDKAMQCGFVIQSTLSKFKLQFTKHCHIRMYTRHLSQT